MTGLQGAEQRVRALALARRDAETQSVQKRETLLRAEAASEAAAAALASTLARAAERLGETAELPEARDTDGQSEERARRKLERLGRERDEMGPVNLRAELELEELDQRLSTPGTGTRGALHRDRQVAWRDRPSEPRGARPSRSRVPAGGCAFPHAVQPA